METEPSTPHLWARLISQYSEERDVKLFTNDNGSNEYKFCDQWKIYQALDVSTTKIINWSASYIKINNRLLEKNEESILETGATIALNKQENEGFDYVFVLMKSEPRNELKRDRDEDHVSQYSNDLEKRIRVEDEWNADRFVDLIFHKEHQAGKRSIESLKDDDSPQIAWKTSNKRGEKAPPKRIAGACQELCSSNTQIKRHQKINFANGDVYEGQTKGTSMHGKGILTLRNGDKYEGTWIDNVIQPQVTINYADGKKFEGKVDPKSLMKQGNGTLTLKSGLPFEGIWIDDVIQPQVTIYYANNGRYDGTINPETLLREGKGFLKISTGDSYEGDFVKEHFEGRGIYTWKDGDVYDGEWKNGKRDGRGTIRYVNGNRFEGTWKKDKRDGKGKIFEVTGDVIEGKWVKDVLKTPVKIYYANGDKYEGEVSKQSFKRDGKGVMIYENGDVFEGNWRNNKKEGKGVLKSRNGHKYQGRWKNDEIIG